MSDEERRSKFRQALDDAADKIGIRTIWSDALEQHKALEEAERRGFEAGWNALFFKEFSASTFDEMEENILIKAAFDDWRASEEYKEGK